MLQSYLVIDDFYDNPDEVRAVALDRCTYPDDHDGLYPGRNSRQFVLPPDSDRMFSQILREPVVGRREMAHGKMRIAVAGDRRSADIHIDPGCSWAGIVYLTRNQDIPEGGGDDAPGTQFFRHVPSGTERAPLSDDEAQNWFGVPTARKALEIAIGRDGRERSRLRHVTTLPMRYNRCVLFRPWFWHTSGVEFGDRLENGRLVQLLFFAPPPGVEARTSPTHAGT